MTLASSQTVPPARFQAWRDPADFRIEWNAENQLTRVLKDSIEVAAFKYDPFGRRIDKSAGGTSHEYTYDGPTILQEIGITTTTATVH